MAFYFSGKAPDHNMDLKINKIRKFIEEIRIINGQILEVVFNNIPKQKLQEANQELKFPCTSKALGFFLFMIKYKDKNTKKIMYLFST